jgi:hypothetical protein
MKTKKLNRNKRRNTYSNKNKNMKGGLLRMNPDIELVNTHICKIAEGSDKTTPGMEVFECISETFILNPQTVGYMQQKFKKSQNDWFKFVVFHNDDKYYISLITGANVNKHSVCMLKGLLDVTEINNEYIDLREAYNKLIAFKKNNTYQDIMENEELKTEFTTLIDNLNLQINKDINCMPVLAAGSGTVNDDNSICINDKSGHYKPTPKSMQLAKTVFEETTGLTIIVTTKANKEDLKLKYGKDYKNYTGICL